MAWCSTHHVIKQDTKAGKWNQKEPSQPFSQVQKWLRSNPAAVRNPTTALYLRRLHSTAEKKYTEENTKVTKTNILGKILGELELPLKHSTSKDWFCHGNHTGKRKRKLLTGAAAARRDSATAARVPANTCYSSKLHYENCKLHDKASLWKALFHQNAASIKRTIH